MTTTPTIDGSLFPWSDPEFQRDPHPWYNRARALGSVHQTDERTYVVTGHEAAMTFVKASVMSIREPSWVPTNPWLAFEHTVLSLDPPDHTKARRLFSRWFTPKLVRQWVEATRTSTQQILDGYVPGEVIDAHHDLGLIPTHHTMCRVLDLPEGDLDPLFWALWDAMKIQATDPAPGTRERSIQGLDYMFGVTEQLLREKQANPGTGLVDEWLAAEARGELPWREVLENVVLFYMSGGPNPAYLIGAGFEVFAERPDVMEDFRTKPEARERIINEVARLNPVELILTRFPTEDVEVDGIRIPAESCVKFPIHAVNRDPEVFANPHEFDWDRPLDASRNLTFGLGTHACAGQLIARAETDVILTMITEQFGSVTLPEPAKVVRTDRLVAYETLPVVLT